MFANATMCTNHKSDLVEGLLPEVFLAKNSLDWKFECNCTILYTASSLGNNCWGERPLCVTSAFLKMCFHYNDGCNLVKEILFLNIVHKLTNLLPF